MENKNEPAKRPGRPKSQEKAQAIRHAAMGLFMADGMERTSMDAVALAAGVSKQTVYSHFKSKAELFQSCVASKIELYSLNAAQFPTDDGFAHLLRHIGRQYLTLLTDSGVIQMFRLMASEAATHQQSVRNFYEAGPRTTTHSIAESIATYLPDGDDNGLLALQITSEYLALIRGDYHLELILGIRTGIEPIEMNHHVDHCIKQIHQLYTFKDSHYPYRDAGKPPLL